MQVIADKIRNHPEVKKRPVIKQLMKFSIVGALNTGIDFIIYLLLTRLSHFWQTHYLWAAGISFSVAVINSYILNKTWTFRDKSKEIHLQFPKFFLISLVALALNELILYFLVGHLKIYDLLAKIIAVILVTFWNFTMNKIWTFKNNGNNGIVETNAS